MTKEGEAERGIATDPIKPLFRTSGDLVDRVGAEVGQFLRFQIAPDILDGIEIRSITWQPLDR